MPMLLVAAFLLFSLIGWSYVLRRLFARQPILSFEPRTAVPWTGWDLLILLLLTILVQGVAFSVIHSWLPGAGELDEAHKLTALIAASAISNTIVFFIMLVYLHLRVRPSRIDLGVNERYVLSDVALGVKAFFVIAVPVYAIQAVLTQLVEPQHPLTDLLGQEATALTWILSFASAVIVAPIFEEFVFRVLLQGWLEKFIARLKGDDLAPHAESTDHDSAVFTEQDVADPRRDPSIPYRTTVYAQELESSRMLQPVLIRPRILPIVVSSVAFAGMHLGQGPAPIPLFFLALALGYIYQRTHRVLPCVVIHLLLNGTTLAVLALSQGQ